MKLYIVNLRMQNDAVRASLMRETLTLSNFLVWYILEVLLIPIFLEWIIGVSQVFYLILYQYTFLNTNTLELNYTLNSRQQT